LFDALAESDEARNALSQIWGRQGYRPYHVGLGAVRAALAYPNLRALTKASVGVMGPDGNAVPQLQQLLTVVKRELATAQTVVQPLPPYLVGAGAQPNRPRSNIEMTAAMMLAQQDAFAASSNEPARFISLRDRRGFVVPAGNQPGVPGTVEAPFSDSNGDGFADVDSFGRFLDGGGAPLAIPAPFAIPGVDSGPTDEFGRPMGGFYAYLDTSRALTGAMSRTLLPLLDGTQYAPPGDPEAWRVEHESLMYLLGGSYLLYGEREDAVYDWCAEEILPAGTDCSKLPACDRDGDGQQDTIGNGERCVSYLRFRGEDSPLPKLLHATGQVLADRDSDVVLLSLIDLLEQHEPVVARLVGAALRVKEIANEHDDKARQGQEPFAALPYRTPIWDEMAEVIARITQHPGLTRKLIGALADPVIVSSIGPVNHWGEALSTFATMRDELHYDPNNINGPALNLTVGAPSTADPQTPVDWNAPQTGKNRSLLQRSIQVIFDTGYVRQCNKPGAQIYSNLLGGVYWPPGGGYSECELFQFENLAAFYLGSVLPPNHPKRSQMIVKPGIINDLLSFVGSGNADTLFQSSSGIDGMTLHPEPKALTRYVFFGASSENYPNLPDHDLINQGSDTDEFISSLIEPTAGAVCAKKANGVPDCGSATADLVRLRDANSMFAWERLGFLDYMRPLLTVFANVACSDDVSICDNNDFTGEGMFIDLNSILNRHWPTADHGPECSSTGNAQTNLRYCSEAGAANYGPILGDAFQGDLIPALHEFAKAALALEVTVERGANAGSQVNGADVLELVTRMLFDPQYAASAGMVDRYDSAATQWVDGTPQAQLTGYSMFADALHEMDVAFDRACGCEGQEAAPLEDCRDACPVKSQWKRGRSQFVDRFLAVEGSGADARFENRATPAMLLTSLRVLREQLNANCPDRELGGGCAWAKKELGDKMAESMSGPLFATMMDLQEQIRLDEPARRELQRFLTYILESASANDSLQATLASVSDLLQLLANDGEMSALFKAAATAANPAADKAGAGCADTTIAVMKALTTDEYDRYHLLDHILPRLVTPMNEDQGLSPLEVIIDTIAEVNRVDSESQEPLSNEDYKFVMGTVRDFFVDERRGLEQLYYIVQRRPRQ
jgi:hypothetical protein